MPVAKKQGKAILIAEHRLYYLRGLADRMLLLQDGRIAHQRPAAEIESLPDAALAGMGLRAFSPASLWAAPPVTPVAPALLEAVALTAGYGKDYPVLSDVSFRLYPGEIVSMQLFLHLAHPTSEPKEW